MNRKIRTLDNNRLDTVEKWIGEKQAELSDFQLLENYNFLVSTVRDYSEGVKTLRDEVANYQRNQIINGINSADKEDWILISDVDEIPNLNKIDLKKLKNK